MVDNRSAGVFGIGGGFNFKSGDASGTAAKMSDEKMGQGDEYFMLQRPEEETRFNEPFVDRSAQLSATLNSLAMANVAGILKNISKSQSSKKIVENDDDTIEQEPKDEDKELEIKKSDALDEETSL